MDAPLYAGHEKADRLDRAAGERHEHGGFVGRETGFFATEADPASAAAYQRHQHGTDIRAGVEFFKDEAIRTRLATGELSQHGIFVLEALGGKCAVNALDTVTGLCFPYDEAMPPDPGFWIPVYVPPLGIVGLSCGDYEPRLLSCAVVLCGTQAHCPGQDPGLPSVIVPVLGVYCVQNSFSLIRADTSAVLDALSFSATLDADSFTWRFSATVPGEQLSDVLGSSDPLELLATLNGEPIALVAESISRTRTFGRSSIAVTGRGLAAWLASPYSPIITRTNTEIRTAQQCANDAITENGVPLPGWAIDWGITDWNVTAGAWSHKGSYIDAILRIAEAGGGYVQPHDTQKTLKILPYYPVAPWHWGTASLDFSLPESVVTTEGIRWIDKPAYNAVYISGGLLHRVKIDGTAGDVLAPTVVDPLATAEEMTRQRGLRVLGDTGKQALVSLRMPILSETGIIRPGNLILYTENGTERRGMCRSASVSWAFPDAWQSLEIETHV